MSSQMEGGSPEQGQTAPDSAKKPNITKWIVVGSLFGALIWKGGIITIGDEGGGSTALVWRSGALSRLSLVDSERKQCSGNFICAGSLAFALRDHPWKLRIGGYSPLVDRLAGK